MSNRLKEFVTKKDKLNSNSEQKEKFLEMDVALIKHEVLNMADSMDKMRTQITS